MTRRLAAAMAAVAISIAASACGASSGSGGNTIIIGVLAPFTGPNAQAATDMMKGVNIAVNEINANGGADGKQLKIVTGDTVSDPTDAVNAASKLINVDGAQIIIGPRTITGPAVLPITERAHVPELIVGGSTILDHNTNPYFFRTSPSDSQQAVAMAAYAAQKGWKRAALAFEEQPAAQTLKTPIIDAFTRHGGQIISTVDIAPAQSSYRSEIQKLYAGKPDVIFTQVSAQTASAFFPEVKQLEGLSTPFLGTNVFDSSNFFQAVGPQIASGAIYAAQSSATSGAGSAHYIDEYQKAYGTRQTANLSPDIYDAVIIAALAVDKSHQVTGPQLAAAITQVANPPGQVVTTYADGVKALKANQKINFDGAAGNDDFNQYHNVFGPYTILHFNAAGTIQTIDTIPASVLANY